MVSLAKNMAPRFLLDANGASIGSIEALATSVVYESADGMADKLEVTFNNPDFVLNDLRVLQPGNELGLWLGYGNALEWIGGAEIVRPKPNFPRSDMPTLQVVAYTRDHRMMDNEPEKGADRRYVDASYDAAVSAVASRYKFEADIDIVDSIATFVHKAGVSDFDFVRGLANITGYFFWVDQDEVGAWTLHFRSPQTYKGQDKRYTFRYNDGDKTTLWSFQPEFLIKGGATKLRVQYRNPDTGTLIDEEVEAEDKEYETKTSKVTDLADGPPASGEAVKIFVGDFSFKVVPSKKFETAQEAKLWAEQWFRRSRQHFITGRAMLPGLESLRARQTHTFANFGPTYDGDYYFSNVRHTATSDGGYECEATARKVLAA